MLFRSALGQAGASIALPAKLLTALVASLPNETVTIQTHENMSATVRAGAAEYTLMGLPGDEYPATPEFEALQTLTLDGEELLTALTRVDFAASDDEARMMLCGVCLDVEAECLTLVSTDTHRVAAATVPLLAVEAGDDATWAAVLPSRVATALRKALKESEGDIDLAIGAALVSITIDDLTILGRVIEGKFPAWRRTIPQESDATTTITLHPGAAMGAIDRNSLIARMESNKVILTTLEGGGVQLHAQSEAGAAKETLPGAVTGAPIEIGFNAGYLHDVLNVLESESVVIGLTTPTHPMRITGQGIDGYVCVVMPMQIL